MGMAASQARYLGLTARKSNVEYEGQQVNQQRTALANQSANLFNQLMSLKVPTPPSTTDYTTTQYSFSDGYNDYVIKSMKPIDDDKYNYEVTYYNDVTNYKGMTRFFSDPQVNPKITGTPVVETGLSGLTPGVTITYDATSGAYDVERRTGTAPNQRRTTYGDSTLWVGSHITSAYSATDDQAACTQIATDNAGSNFATAWAAAKTSGNYSTILSFMSGGQKYYTCTADLAETMATSTSITDITVGQANLRSYYAADVEEQNISENKKAYLETNDSGRFTSIKLEEYDDQEFQLHAETTTDQLAYEDAMNQYAYDINVYEKQIQDINAKTEIIQQEDRTLELRLKQLDTEQEALQTEMDAVKKVIDKNIEQTFKTFA